MLPSMVESVVTIADIRSAARRVLDAAEQLLGPIVHLTGDFYWHLPVVDAFDLTVRPSNFTMGQLSDDLEMLGEREALEPELTWHELSHLVGLLRALEVAARL